MSRDLYASLAGASATLVQMDVAANNLANASTTGFRQGRVAFQLSGTGDGVLGQSDARSSRVYLSEQDGSLDQDGDPLHVALSGQGYFVVQAGGEQLLTRDGRLSLDNSGQLTTLSGAPIMGDGGPIEVIPGEHVSIAADGTVTGSESGPLGRLRVVDAVVEPAGGNMLRAVGATRASSAAVHQGALESSNVDTMRVMVELMEAGRYFEAFNKAMQASDDADARMNQVGGG